MAEIIDLHKECKRLLDTKQLCCYLSLGKNKAVEFGTDANAKVKYGKRVLWDKTKIDQKINDLTTDTQG